MSELKDLKEHVENLSGWLDQIADHQAKMYQLVDILCSLNEEAVEKKIQERLDDSPIIKV